MSNSLDEGEREEVRGGRTALFRGFVSSWDKEEEERLAEGAD